MNGNQYPMPYSIDSIASAAVKAAATAKNQYTSNGYMRVASAELANEMKMYLGGFDNHVTDLLIRQVYEFIGFLICRFEMSNWYAIDDECPYRFIGFTAPYSATYDIVVSCG